MEPHRIESLRDPAAYPERPDAVEIVQTHLSVVCLVGGVAYKLKKSIRLPFADFSNLESRRAYCEEECRLNRRLCPDIYLSVVPLRRRADGGLTFDPDSIGEIVDHAVKMRRMPAERMLDVLLAEDRVDAADIRRIARQMVAFHRGAERGPEVLDWGSPQKLASFALANFDEARAAVGSLFSAPLFAALEARTRDDFARCLPRLLSRAASGHVVDGHGDLHARNICLIDPPAIYDCIEFAPAFRCGDVATEHAFLVMDLRHRGHPELAAAYLDEVVQVSGDAGIRGVLPPLLRYRAMVRAKVSAIAASEAELDNDARATAAEAARQYLRLAAATAVEDDGPWWLTFCGLPGSGKSSIAAALTVAAGGAWPVLASDPIRKELAGTDATETLPASCYTAAFSHRVYDEMIRRAVAATAPGRVIVLDGNFRERGSRERAIDAAHRTGARVALLAVETDEPTIISRLHRREADLSASVSDAGREVYRRLRDQFEAPAVTEADRFLAVSGSDPASVAAESVLADLLAGSVPEKAVATDQNIAGW